MEVLRAYLNSLPGVGQAAFAQRCGTSLGYLRKVLSTGQRIGAELCINIERESEGAVSCEALRPDVDWHVLRNTPPATPSTPADPAPTAIHFGSEVGHAA